ncbi:MAG: extracellular solute-binding protein [Lentisphaeria bacterium]|nr:extracellular solute-binding protein [Lentisphaeria bacterium]
MRNPRTILLCLAFLVVVWLLHPRRTLREQRVSGEVIEIIYMGPGGPIGGAMADAVREFEVLSEQAHARDPSQPIYRVISGQNAAQNQVADPTRFLISVAGGTPPDVIWFDRYAIAEWAARGAFTPLDAYIERDLDAGRTDTPAGNRFFASCWDEARYDGRVYGIPTSVDDRALLYNRDLLRQAGLVDADGEPLPPRTWEELAEYARKLTRRDADGKLACVGFAPQFGNSWLYMYGWMAGGSFLSPDGRTCTLNHPRIVEALQYMVDVYESIGGYAEVAAFQAGFQGGELDPFIQGKIAMKIDGSWQMPFLAAYGRNLDFGAAPPPMPRRELDAGKPHISWNGGWAYAIPTTARNKDAAWEFIRFMTGERAFTIWMESEREIAEAQGRLFIPRQLPLRDLNDHFFEKYVYDNPRIPATVRDGCRVYNKLLPDARFRPVTPVGQLLWNQHAEAMEAALYKRATPKQALDNGTAIVQRDLDRVLSPPKGRPVNWHGFFVLYAALLLLAGAALYLLDTHRGWRRRLLRVLRLRGAADAVVEGSSGGYFRSQWKSGWLCAAPWIIGFVVFGGGPMLFSLVMSTCDYDILNPPRFTGLDNYRWLFTRDKLFPLALGNTLYMVVGVPLGMAMSLSVALLLNLKIRGMAVWRTFFYLPAIVPMVASSILWIWIFNPQGGLINRALSLLRLEGPLWLQSPAWSKPSIILMGLWGAGSGMIIWLAGLKGINEQLYEAASLDGANAWKRFRHVTIPQLTPYIFFNLVMGLIHTFQIFGQAFIMTHGGPDNSTLFYVYHLFNNAFRYGHMGYASAMAWVLFVIVLAITAFQLRFSKRWVYYESE